MRLELVLSAAFAACTCVTALAEEPAKVNVELRHDGLPAPGSPSLAPGLPLWDGDKGVYALRLTAQLDGKGEGKGTLDLDPNAPAFDEFGFVTRAGALRQVTLDCTFKVVKKETLQWGGPRLREEEWLLLDVRGPKITGRLRLATPTAARWSSGRLLVLDKEGKVKHVISLTKPPPPEPCHPGCFPATTTILIPGGTKAIERLRAGDVITTVSPEGRSSQARVAGVFTTTNRLVEVATDAGNLITTQTQPLALTAGGLQAAGELKKGDRISLWQEGKRRTATVRSVSLTGREERVFNLIVPEPVLFVADGFLVRSKPPAPTAPAQGVPSTTSP